MNKKELANQYAQLKKEHDELVKGMPKLMVAMIDSTVNFISERFRVLHIGSDQVATAEEINDATRDQFLQELDEGIHPTRRVKCAPDRVVR